MVNGGGYLAGGEGAGGSGGGLRVRVGEEIFWSRERDCEDEYSMGKFMDTYDHGINAYPRLCRVWFSVRRC